MRKYSWPALLAATCADTPGACRTTSGCLQRTPCLRRAPQPLVWAGASRTWLSSTSHSPSLATTRNSSPSCSASSVTSGMEVTGSPVKCLQATGGRHECRAWGQGHTGSREGRDECNGRPGKGGSRCGQEGGAAFCAKQAIGMARPARSRWLPGRRPPAVRKRLVPQLKVNALLEQQLQALLPLELHVAKRPAAWGGRERLASSN